MQNRRLRLQHALVVPLLCLLSAGAWAGVSFPSQDRVSQALVTGQPQDLIVEFVADRQLDNLNDLRRARGLTAFDSDLLTTLAVDLSVNKAQVYDVLPMTEWRLLREYSHLPMSLVRIRTASALDALIRNPSVRAVHENRKSYLNLDQSLPLIRQPDAALQGDTGSGEGIVVIDTGLNYTLPEFGQCQQPGDSGCRVAYAADFTSADDGYLDDNGHGTYVSAIALGVAPDARILALDAYSSGFFLDSDLISAINWSISNQGLYNIHVINMSLGSDTPLYASPCASDALAAPIDLARQTGITVVISSGNDGNSSAMRRPACVPGALSVGAVYDDTLGAQAWSGCSDPSSAADQVACFSNSAGFLSLLAPGAVIDAAGYSGGGTSMAAPHVSGAAAVAAAAYAGETLGQREFRLIDTGVPITDHRNGLTFPRLDLYEALSPAFYRTLTIRKAFSAQGGSVTSDLGSLECDTACSEETVALFVGTEITLQANPSDGYTFEGWSGADCTGMGDCTITLETDQQVTAVFSERHDYALQLISRDPSGTAIGGESPSLSSDGRYVAFVSDSTVMMPDEYARFRANPFVFDRQTDQMRLASEPWSGTAWMAYAPRLSGDGRYLVYERGVIGDSSSRVLYLYDLTTDTWQVASVDGSGNTVTHSDSASISGDGRYIAYERTTDLVNNLEKVYLFDQVSDSTQEIGSTLPSQSPGVSADGSLVAYVRNGNLIDIYDTSTQQTTTIDPADCSLTFDVIEGSNISLSSDGRYVAFRTLRVVSAVEQYSRVIEYDRTLAACRTIGDEFTPSPNVRHLSISDDGRYAVYEQGILDLQNDELVPAMYPGIRQMSLSPDGRYIAMQTSEPLDPGDQNANDYDVYAHLNPMLLSNPVVTITGISSLTPVIGEGYGVSVQVTGGGSIPTGSLSVTDTVDSCTITLANGTGECLLSTDALGARPLIIHYSGDGFHEVATIIQDNAVTVGKADTDLAIVSDSPDPSIVGQSYHVEFDLQVRSPGSGQPTGTVVVGNGTDSCSVTLPDSGCDFTPSLVGSESITASYSGDALYTASTAQSESHQVTVAAQLQVSRSGTGAGVVVSEPAGIDCGGECTGQFASAATVTLTAIPDAGSTFLGWSGGGCSGVGTCQVVMDGDQQVDADFSVVTPGPSGCNESPITIADAVYATGSSSLSSEVSIMAMDVVGVLPGAALDLRAPGIVLKPEFKVHRGAVVTIKAEGVDCGL